jgi:5,10-methylenetetrahydrofolate reductase
MRLGKKIEAGAEFIQTQICFNLAKMRLFMARCADLGLLDRVSLLAGVFVPRSAKAVRYLRDQVPGIDVPEEVVDRLDAVPPREQRAEGIRLALEIVEEVRVIPGVSGVHLMTIRNEDAIVEVVERAGLLPRPSSVPQTVG